jgi:hypothetical protein
MKKLNQKSIFITCCVVFFLGLFAFGTLAVTGYLGDESNSDESSANISQAISENDRLTNESSLNIPKEGIGYYKEGTLDDMIEENTEVTLETIPYVSEFNNIVSIDPASDTIYETPIYISSLPRIDDSIMAYTKSHKTTFIKTIDDNYAYTVDKFYKDDYPIYLYSLFVNKANDTNNIYPGYEHWKLAVKNSYFVSKALSYVDFKSIQIGDPWGIVNDVDPVVSAYIEKCMYTYDKEGYVYAHSFHLLKDGLMIITYETVRPEGYKYFNKSVKNVNVINDFKVSDIKFYENYESIDEKYDCGLFHGKFILPEN